MMSRRNLAFKYLTTFLILMLVPLLLGGWGIIPKSIGQFRNWSIAFIVGSALALMIPSVRKDAREFMQGRMEPTEQETTWLRNAVIALFSVAFLKATLLDYFVFHVNGVDFSIYDLTMMNTLRGRFMESFDGTPHMGVHSTYLLLGLLPLHAIFHHPIFSLLLEPILLASAAFPIWKLSENLRNSTRLAVLISYFLSTWVAKNLHYHFHVEVFYVPFFLWLHHFVKKENLRAALIFSTLICLTKEDGPFYLLPYWFAVYLTGRFSKKIVTLTCVSIAGFLVLNLKWAMPEFRGGVTYALAGRAATYGNDFSSILHALPHAIPQILKNFFVGEWWKAWALFVFLPLLTTYSAFPSLAVVGIYSLGGQLMGGLLAYDSAPLIPFFWIGWIELVSGSSGIASVRAFASRFETPVSWLITLLILTVGSGYLVFRPIHLEDALRTHSLLADIPQTETVCTQTVLIPHLRYPRESFPLTQKCLDDSRVTLYVLTTAYQTYPHSPAEIIVWMESLKKRMDIQCEEKERLLFCKRSGI